MAPRVFSWMNPARWPSLLVAMAVLVVMFLLSGAILAISVRLLGGLEAHHSAWQAAWPWLLAWRLSLYAALDLVWWRKVRPGWWRDCGETATMGSRRSASSAGSS